MKRLVLILLLLFLVSCGLKVELSTPTLTVRDILKEPMVGGEITYIYYFPIVYNTQTSEKSLGNEFLKYDIKFGFAVGSNIRTNEIKNKLVKYHAKVVTMENAYKMNDIQHIKGVFNFWGADQIILFGNENNIDVYGHGISWSAYNPDWLSYVPKSELAYELDKHIRVVCSHYQGLDAMDVSNEAYMGVGGSLNAGEWSPLENDYVNISFNSCRDVTSTKIFYNSFFWTIYDAQKAVKLLDSGLAYGIGIQLHLTEGVDYQGEFDRVNYIIKESRKRGTPVRFSEVGILANSDKTQAKIYREVVRLALNNSDVVTDFIIWGTTDPCWRGNVTLFNSDGSPKLSYYAILEELEDN